MMDIPWPRVFAVIGAVFWFGYSYKAPKTGKIRFNFWDSSKHNRVIHRHEEPFFFWFLYFSNLTVCMTLLVYAFMGTKGLVLIAERVFDLFI